MSSEKLFQEKLEILNSNFVRFLADSLKDKPHADCTPTVKDYMNHVEELDKMYGDDSTKKLRVTFGASPEKKTASSSGNALPSLSEMFKPKPGSWECPSCMTTNQAEKSECPCCNTVKPGGTEKPKDIFATKTPVTSTSTIPSFGFQPKQTSDDSAKKPQVTFGANVSSITTTSTNTAISRKRRNEDQDPYFSNKLGGNSTSQQNGDKDAENGIKSDDSAKKPQITFGASPEKKTASSSGNALPSLSEMFKPKPGSWECPSCMTTNQAEKSECPCCNTVKPGGTEKPKDNSATKTPVTSTATIPSFGFQPKQTSDDSAKKPQITFGTSLEKKTAPSSGNALPSLSEMFKRKPGSWECPSCMTTNQAEQSECPCCKTIKPGGTEKPKDNSANKTPVTSTSTIPSFGFQPKQTSPLSFGTSSTTTANLTTSTLPSFGLQSKSGSSLIFGKSSTTFGGGSSTTPIFPFGLKPSSAPAAEIEQTEKGAVCSHECIVHSFVDGKWEKRGKGYASIKHLENSDKKQLIIRAANTLGTVWTNTLINSSLKWSKVKDKSQKETQLRISYPTPGKDATQITTLLLKFGSEAHTKELCDHFE
ncbi:nuclear pore complex protein [Ditylenchus destructor]|nr:nuclear pore complex protein [Ditylenchus destructor]